MALPTEVQDPAISLIATYCATKVPAEHDSKLRIEYKVRDLDNDPTGIFWG